MPWENPPVSEVRLAFIHQVITLNSSVAHACREFRISRKTGYKWLDRYRQQPEQPLNDLSRKPRTSPKRTGDPVETRILEVRDRFGWGARKIHAFLTERNVPVPAARTITNILRRHGRIVTKQKTDPENIQFFERSQPHQLWQCDHKGPIEVGRRKLHPFTVLDDHSRFLIALEPCLDVSMKPAFDVLWKAFGEFGMPEAILCDNAFSTAFQVPKTISWFEAQLIRLHIQPIHGRPYHPQTQGKVERLHGTLEREVWPHVRKDSIDHFDEDITNWRRDVYNTIRPHEAIGDKPPVSRFRPSTRTRPKRLPPVEYEAGSLLRIVSTSGDVRWNNLRILAGRGLVGQFVRIEERDHEIALFYDWKEIRTIPVQHLIPGKML